MGQWGHSEGKWSVFSKTPADCLCRDTKRELETTLAFLWSWSDLCQLLGNAAPRTCYLSATQLCQKWVLIICFDLSSLFIFKNFRDHRNKMFLFRLIHESLRQRQSGKTEHPSLHTTHQGDDRWREGVSVRLKAHKLHRAGKKTAWTFLPHKLNDWSFLPKQPDKRHRSSN